MQQMSSAVVILLAVAMGCRAARVPNETPIGKVLQMLADLHAKVKADGEAAKRTYGEFADFCEDRSKDLVFEIKTGKEDVQKLEALIAKEDTVITLLTTKIEDLAAKIATAEAELKVLTETRTHEAASFTAEEKELMECLDALERALHILRTEMQKSGTAMLQSQGTRNAIQALSTLVGSSALSSADETRLTALVQGLQNSKEELDNTALGAPDAAVYEGQSGDIIDTLVSLRKSAQQHLDEMRKAEIDAVHNFELLKQSLEDSITYCTRDLEAAKKSRAESNERKVGAVGELAATSKDLAADTSALGLLREQCSVKAQEFEAATKSRGEELKALAAAMKVIAEETAGSQKLYFGHSSLMQLSRARAMSGEHLPPVFKAIHVVRDLASRHNSSSLMQLASRLAATVDAGSVAGDVDPFKKVKALITDCIARLEDEADAEASHKAYCDKELASNELRKTDKTGEIEKLSAKIDLMATRSEQLKDEVAALEKGLAELASSQPEMDKLRQAEHAEYVKCRADLEQGLEGVKLALKILREYYDADGKAHAAAEGAASSIIGLLEVVESDLSIGLAGIIANEQSAQASYQTAENDNKIEKTVKEQDVKYKIKEASDLDRAVAEASSDKARIQAELDAVLETLASLHKQCTEVVTTYEEREKCRRDEIAGLREALACLEGEPVLLQQNTQRMAQEPRPHHLAT